MSRHTRHGGEGRKPSKKLGRPVDERKSRPLGIENLEDRVVPAVTFSKTVFFGNPTTVASVSGDVTGDRVRDTVVASGSTFMVYGGVPARQLTTFTAFPAPARGTLQFAVGDITGDGKADLQVWAKLKGSTNTTYKFYDAATLVGSPTVPPTVPPAAAPAGVFGNSGAVVEGGAASVNFTQVTDPLGRAVKYSYDFNNDGTFEVTDSTSATAAVPAALTADGPKAVAVRGRLTSTDGRFADYTTQVQVTNAAPAAAVGAATYTATPGSAIAFQGSATDPSVADAAAGFTYTWNFGDGATGTGASPTHAYTAAGTYTVTLTVKDKDGATATATATAKVTTSTTPPAATFGNSGPVAEGAAANVSFSQVSDPLGQAVTYSYDFGNDGTFDVANSASPTAAVPAALTADGPKTVAVRGRVTAADGRFAEFTTQVQVTNAAPTPTAGGSSVVPAGTAASFQATATDPSAADAAAGFTYTWNFGDGSTATGANPTHTYASAGNYNVTLTAQDKDGATGTTTRSLTVYTQAQTDSGVVVTPDWIITKYEKIPNFGGYPTRVAAQSGPWSDPATWGGQVPAAGDIVSIGAGVTVTYDVVSDAKLDTVSVGAGGTLTFRTDASTRLRVTNLLVLEGGTLTIGTQANPVAAAVKAEVIINDLPLDTTKDPEQYGHGLLAFGKVTVHGAMLSDTFMTLAVEPKAGATTLTLAATVSGWKAGDRIILPDTRQLYSGILPTEQGSAYAPQWETLTVAGVSADGKTITLASPVAYDHLGARDPDGRLDFRPHVANITRNVVIKSENSLGSRGHTLFTARADVDVRYAQFAGLGRTTNDFIDNTKYDAAGNVTSVGTNQVDRYPVNFYHLRGPATLPANGSQFTFEGNSVVCLMNQFQFRWGVAINDSHFGLVSKNVVFNWAGAGIVFGQSGNETGNVVAANFVSRVQGTGGRMDDRGDRDVGHEGAGLWTRSADNFVRDNVVSNSRQGYAVIPDGLWQVRRPLYRGADTTTAGQYEFVDPRNLPLREFARNEVYGGATEIGLSIWSLGTASYVPFADAQESVVKDYRVWNVWSKGYYNYKVNRVTFDGVVARGDAALLASGRNNAIMFYAGDYATYNFKLTNSDIQGFRIGYACGSMGDQEISNTYLRNYQDVMVTPMYWLNSADQLPSRRLTVTNVTFEVLDAPEWWTGPKAAISMVGLFQGTNNTAVTKDEVYVYGYNGDPTKNYRVYYNEQAATYVLPQTQVKADGTVTLWGAPVAGLTNAQAWTLYGLAYAGSVAPAATTTMVGVNGLVTPI